MGIARKTTEVKYVLKGPQGNKGAKLRIRQWAVGQECLSGAGNEPFYDVVVYNDKRYLCLESHTASTANNPQTSVAQNLGYWEIVQDWAFIATKLLLTENIDASQIDVDSLRVKHLDGADGTFKGSLSAATGTFSGSLNAATGIFSGTVSIKAGGYTLKIDSDFTEYRIYNSSNVAIASLQAYTDIPGSSPKLFLRDSRNINRADLDIFGLSVGDANGTYGYFSYNGIQFRQRGTVYQGVTGSFSITDSNGNTTRLHFKNGICYKIE